MVPGNRSGGLWCDSISVNVEGAQSNWFPRLGDDQTVLGKAVAAPDVGRGFAADQQRAGAVGDQRGVQDVVEMRMHRDDRRQP